MNELTINQHSLAHIKFSANWKDETGQHIAIQHVEKFNAWRDMDLLPEAVAKEILGHQSGHHMAQRFKAGELVPGWQQARKVQLSADNFSGRYRSGAPIQPRAGRFYPKGMITEVNGYYSENMFPTRFVQQQGEQIVVDYNHPLAKHDIDLEVEVINVLKAGDEHGGRCNDVLAELLNNGPGMQSPHPDSSTEFVDKSAFQRADDEADSVFYQKLRKVHHLDANARQTIAELYGQLLAASSRVLDLMSSWESHLPETLDLSVSGLGMNRAELQANPQLADFVVHDLNQQPALSAQDESFDAVICTASVEYLVNPLKVFEEIRRVLKPGGVCVMTFSNRWFPTKAINLWTEIHEFERVGLVIDNFRQSGWSGDINSFSSRGLQRPLDDPHAAKTSISDPVYAVWSYK